MDDVVCAGYCNRRGPQVQLVDHVEDITCVECLDKLTLGRLSGR